MSNFVKFWERILHKHIQIPALVLVQNPFSKSVPIAKLHSLIAVLIKNGQIKLPQITSCMSSMGK